MPCKKRFTDGLTLMIEGERGSLVIRSLVAGRWVGGLVIVHTSHQLTHDHHVKLGTSKLRARCPHCQDVINKEGCSFVAATCCRHHRCDRCALVDVQMPVLNLHVSFSRSDSGHRLSHTLFYIDDLSLPPRLIDILYIQCLLLVFLFTTLCMTLACF